MVQVANFKKKKAHLYFSKIIHIRICLQVSIFLKKYQIFQLISKQQELGFIIVIFRMVHLPNYECYLKLASILQTVLNGCKLSDNLKGL